MKRYCSLALSFALILIMVFSTWGGVPAHAAAAEYRFRHTEKDITIDGAADANEDWDKIEWTALHKTGGNAEEQAGYSARFKGMWSDSGESTYIYFLLEITDPTVSAATDWTGDAFWINFNDGTNHFWTSTILLGNQTNADNKGNGKGLVRYSMADTRSTNNVCMIEGRFAIADVDSFLFDILVQDNAGTGKYVRYAWSNLTGSQGNMEGIGKLDSADGKQETELIGEDAYGRYQIYRALGEITLDGQAGSAEAWDAVAWTAPFNRTRTDSSGVVQENYTAAMKMLWQKEGDNAYLYFLVESNDATTSFDLKSWLADCITFVVDEDGDGTRDLATAALYVPTRDGYTLPNFEYRMTDRRAAGNGFTVEARYTFKDASNCAGNVLLDVFLQDNVATTEKGSNYNRYAWKSMYDSSQAPSGVGVISDLAVFAVHTTAGASVRIDTSEPTKSGIRFRTSADADAIARLEEAGATVTTGTLLMPTAFVTANGITGFTKAELTEKGLQSGVDYYDIVNLGNTWVDGEPAGTWYGTLFNIKAFGRSFSAVGYVTVTLSDGTVYTIYGGYDPANARTVAEVARKAMEGEEPGDGGTYNALQEEILRNFYEGETQP